MRVAGCEAGTPREKASEWVHTQSVQTQHPVANGATYAIYRHFDGDLHKLETWCYTYVAVYGESPLRASE